MLNVLKSIRSRWVWQYIGGCGPINNDVMSSIYSELEESLLVMPFDQVIHLLTLTDVWLQVSNKGWGL